MRPSVIFPLGAVKSLKVSFKLTVFTGFIVNNFLFSFWFELSILSNGEIVVEFRDDRTGIVCWC